MWISLSLSIAMWIYQYGFSLCFSNKRVARTQIWLACGLSSWAYLRIYDRAMSLMSVVAAMVLAKMSLFESTLHFQCSSWYVYMFLQKHMLNPLLWTYWNPICSRYIKIIFLRSFWQPENPLRVSWRETPYHSSQEIQFSIVQPCCDQEITQTASDLRMCQRKLPDFDKRYSSQCSLQTVMSCALQLYHAWSILGFKEYRKGTKLWFYSHPQKN